MKAVTAHMGNREESYSPPLLRCPLAHCLCWVPGSPHSTRVSEVDEDAPMRTEEEWTEQRRSGTTALSLLSHSL